MTKCVVAVSGGVDSVVLLDMLMRLDDIKLIVAHFDHGIRDDSRQDAEFVMEIARKYGLPFEIKREKLGLSASEEKARDRRYKFLRSVAKKYKAKLVTAHHADDVIETIAINILRGTGWRGLSIMDSDIWRPLTDMTKSEIIDYAKKHNLTWREDITNTSDKYLRNRIRRQTNKLDGDTKQQLLGLWSTQKSLKASIDKELVKLVDNGPNYSRYFFTYLDSAMAIECLRFVVDARLTRPQLQKTLHAIKTISPNKVFQAGNGVKIKFTSRNFTVELIK
jgi:tRNA(Ile)-lysidine synthetase-like protein